LRPAKICVGSVGTLLNLGIGAGDISLPFVGGWKEDVLLVSGFGRAVVLKSKPGRSRRGEFCAEVERDAKEVVEAMVPPPPRKVSRAVGRSWDSSVMLEKRSVLIEEARLRVVGRRGGRPFTGEAVEEREIVLALQHSLVSR